MTSRRETIKDDTHFWVLKLMQDNPGMTQRALAKELGISLGGANYCLQALVEKGWLKIQNFSKSENKLGYAWLDTGTHDSLLEAASFIATLQKRQGLQVSCPEEIAFAQKWIDAEQIQKLATPLAKNGYGQYLLGLLK